MNRTTDNLAEFGMRELGIAAQLLTAYASDKGNRNIDPNFGDEGVKLMMNTSSGFVFLTNSEFEVLMMHNGVLEQFFSCSYCGHEGFRDEFKHEAQDPDCFAEMRRVSGKDDGEDE